MVLCTSFTALFLVKMLAWKNDLRNNEYAKYNHNITAINNDVIYKSLI